MFWKVSQNPARKWPFPAVNFLQKVFKWMWSETDDMAQHQRRYTAKELKTKLERAGFTCEYMTSFVSLLLPAMVLSRLKNRNEPGNKKHGSEIDELKLPGILNRMFEAIMTVERGMI
ncbi:MAG: hypothetical protein HQK65_21465 [Desulfamplus sp.]|nr:hypothetical protein [Desulfamplus sp.]